jgi:hypothetical protein
MTTRIALMNEIEQERQFLATLSIQERARRLKTPPENYNSDGTATIITAWESHCREAGHSPTSQGGGAQYTRNNAATYAICITGDCQWEFNT